MPPQPGMPPQGMPPQYAQPNPPKKGGSAGIIIAVVVGVLALLIIMLVVSIKLFAAKPAPATGTALYDMIDETAAYSYGSDVEGGSEETWD